LSIINISFIFLAHMAKGHAVFYYHFVSINYLISVGMTTTSVSRHILTFVIYCKTSHYNLLLKPLYQIKPNFVGLVPRR